MSTAVTGPQLQQLFGHAYTEGCNVYSRGIFTKLQHCHTAAMGMHHYRCDDANCNHLHQQYHSCGNRHCPNCGGMKKEQWIEDLTAQLFPTAYYHVVFTVPHEFNSLTLGNRRHMYNLLFDAASSTLLQLAADPQWLGATCGITAVLHTWGQNLSFHPHLHCIVSGGGVKDNQWVAAKRANSKFLFPVAVIQPVFKAIYFKKLRQMLAAGALQTDGIDVEKLIKKTGFKKWNVYAKSPFGSVANVVEYLGRYTHKVAITRHRMLDIGEHTVTFKYRDYADSNKQKTMTLSKAAFLQRFELHFLPERYVKIRHYGFLQNHSKTTRLNAVRKTMHLQPLPPKVIIPVAQRMLEQFGTDINLCPKCNRGRLVLVKIEYPKWYATAIPLSTTISQPIELHNKDKPAGSGRASP